MTSTTADTASAAAPSAPEPRASDTFVRYVLQLCQDKKKQAELRSGLGRPVQRCNYLHRYLVPRLPVEQHPDAKRAHYAVAALIAARPRSARDADAAAEAAVPADRPEPLPWWGRPNLGAALAQGVRAGALKPGSAEAELHLFTRQSCEAIHPRLPALTRHLQLAGITIDWAVLLEDLSWWNYDRDAVATRWLESYFRTLAAEDNPPGGGHGTGQGAGDADQNES